MREGEGKNKIVLDGGHIAPMQFVAPHTLVSAGDLTLHLHPDHLADLRRSGLTDETIRAAGAYSLRPCDLDLFFNARRGVPKDLKSALCFPYQGGEFARIKLFPSLGKMKYAQPPKTGARLYMPFAVDSRPLPPVMMLRHCVQRSGYQKE